MAYIGNDPSNRFVAPKAASVFSGDGSTTAFTLDHAVGSDEDILVSVDGVIQEPSVAYAVSSGTTLTFTAAPSSNSGNNIFVYYLFRTVGTVSHPSNNALQASDITVDTTTLVTDSTNNRVGIGTASPSKTLHIRTANSSATAESNSAVIIEGTDATRADLQFLGDASAFQAIYFGDNSDADIGRIAYDHTGNTMRFNVNATERARITSAGFTKFANSGTFRSSTGEFHEFNSDDSGDAGVTVSTSNASYTGDTIQGITTRDNAGSATNLLALFSNNAGDREFKIDGSGTTTADGGFNATGADYAEYFEWKDGNTNSEDRVGKTVVLDGNKIRLSTSDDTQSTIIGVVSARPVVLGDAHEEKWKHKYETDDYGRYIREEYTQTEWKEGDNFLTYQTDKIPSDVTVPKDAKVTSKDNNGDKLTRRKLNTAFDESITYTPRSKRKEFSPIGLVGKLKVNVGQTIGDRWIKMREISDTVHEYLVR
jgi:hypothetical protein